jgi:uncharacterized protein (DUF1499 family)
MAATARASLRSTTSPRTENPPAFVALVAAPPVSRATTYPGSATAEQQKRGYPDLKPLELPLPPADAFARALGAGKAMGWEIAAADAAAGRIEATAKTPWFGFRDDIVIRVAPAPAGSRIDVRSVSRVGRGDLWTNAKRIRAYLDKLAHA